MHTIVVLPDNLAKVAREKAVMPAGYYSQSQCGSHSNQYIRLEWEGAVDDGDLPAFTYWQESQRVNPANVR